MAAGSEGRVDIPAPRLRVEITQGFVEQYCPVPIHESFVPLLDAQLRQDFFVFVGDGLGFQPRLDQ